MKRAILFILIFLISGCSYGNSSSNSSDEASASTQTMSKYTAENTIQDSSRNNVYQSSDQYKAEETTTVDTLNLTNDQAISWVKNYWLQQGAVPDSNNDIIYKTQFSKDGYLEIVRYTWNLAHTAQTLSDIYRVNEKGYLQEGNAYSGSGEPWETISESYLGD